MESLLDQAWLGQVVNLLVRIVETFGVVIVFLGAVIAFVRFVLVAVQTRNAQNFTRVRLGLGRYLALGLEFQLASDILRTALAPALRDLAALAAIAAIRTGLNYFLGREIRQEHSELRPERTSERGERGDRGERGGVDPSEASAGAV
ncbi:DUF1622 domain-containing protein [Micromonosporaceae bacterium DT194]|uniref:DUF1622 domain-containing protein n=1 Tax=Melissospora conviva TaxID=3388432 RepID=UPI003C1DB4F8